MEIIGWQLGEKKSFMVLRFLISLFHKSHILLHPHQDTKVVQMLIGAAGKYCAKRIVNNASTKMMSSPGFHCSFFFFFHLVSSVVKSLNV